ncbi:MAG: hypothetical protein RIC80_16235 [Cyclobacteriaceae bacterium]
MIAGSLMSYYNDTLEPTRKELEEFFAAGLSNCRINSVVYRQYSGRGQYQLFRTDCSSNYYPILLDAKADSDQYNSFEEGLIVNKEARSLELTLTGSDKRIELNIRHSSEEDDRIDRMQFVVLFFGCAILFMLFIPNSFWERKGT